MRRLVMAPCPGSCYGGPLGDWVSPSALRAPSQLRSLCTALGNPPKPTGAGSWKRVGWAAPGADSAAPERGRGAPHFQSTSLGTEQRRGGARAATHHSLTLSSRPGPFTSLFPAGVLAPDALGMGGAERPGLAWEGPATPSGQGGHGWPLFAPGDATWSVDLA